MLSVKVRAGKGSSGDNRAKLTIFGLDSFAVFRSSLLVFSLLFGVFIVAWALLWSLFGLSGYEARTNNLIDQLIGSTTYHLIGWQIFLVLVGLGAFFVLFSSVVTYIIVRLINLALYAVGGVDVFVAKTRSQKR